MQIAKSAYCSTLNTRLALGDKALLELYKSGKFDIPTSERINTSKIPDITGLKLSYTSNMLRDNFENGKALYESLPITPLQASDERLWVFLTHVTFKKYMLELRPIDEKSTGKFIKTHYFVPSAKFLFLNDISLLWWMFHFSVKPENKKDPYLLTRELFSMADYTRHLFGGKIGRARGVRHGVLSFVVNNQDVFKEYKAFKIRFILRMLNQTAGNILISLLGEDEIYEILENNKNKIAELKDASKN
jgi:hypothetical protein